MTDDAFFDLCTSVETLRLERAANGEVVINLPHGGRAGSRNAGVTRGLQLWTEADARGLAFASGTMFLLPNSAMLAPDAAWVELSRLRTIPETQRERFVTMCPDFVIELRCHSDRLRDLKAKMEEWMSNGCSLAWLLDPSTRTAYIYTSSGCTELAAPASLQGEGPVTGFRLDMTRIWDPGW